MVFPYYLRKCERCNTYFKGKTKGTHVCNSCMKLIYKEVAKKKRLNFLKKQ